MKQELKVSPAKKIKPLFSKNQMRGLVLIHLVLLNAIFCY